MRHSTIAINLYGHLLENSADEAVLALANAPDRADTERGSGLGAAVRPAA